MDVLNKVVRNQLCTGCGGCAYANPGRYGMEDTLEYGRRPFLLNTPSKPNSLELTICPGLELGHKEGALNGDGIHQDMASTWGPIYGVWEGYASDQEIRFSGSSGGAASALALYCIEQQGMGGVLHTAARKDIPYLNETVISNTREQILARSGSRYSPASPCEGLGQIERSSKKHVFIGKPCDVAATKKAADANPALNDKLGLTIAFFCAGTPSLLGNIDLMLSVGVDKLNSVSNLRFRGNGWPGLWKVSWQDKAEDTLSSRELSYAESWGFLQKYRQWRCYICPDHTGEFADIAVGDPWYKKYDRNEPGKSLIVARTQKGLRLLREAHQAGYIVLETEDLSLLPRSQQNLAATRGALWGRLLALRLLGVRVPKFKNFRLFYNWKTHLTLAQKISSFTGTVKRIFEKQLHVAIVLKKFRNL